MPQRTMSVPDRSRGPRARESVMTDYLLLYSGGSMPETEEEQKTVMEAWNTWMGQLGSSLKDGGNPFTPATKTISADGSVSDGGGTASGYSIVSADSLDAATEMAKGCPVLQGGAQQARREEGVEYEVLDAGALVERWPAWHVSDEVLAIHQRDAGIVAASRANAVHRRLALARGADLLPDTRVERISPDGDGFALETATRTYRCGSIVVAADAWMNDMLAPFSMHLP